MLVRTCLCLIRRTAPDGGGTGGGEVLLGLKKTGFGAGRWVGVGGHVEDGEKPAAAAVREVFEETSLIVPADALEHMASIEFRFPHRPAWDQTAEVYLTDSFAGQPQESDEIVPRWYPVGALPLAGMWDDARYWLPRVLAGQHVAVTVTFAADNATVERMEPDLPLA
jgi:8-oxo-dGTP diphosphatase